ncbi:hypothetical protein BACI9J_60294 [Bacillus altitudinis]|nr:hypothetical protein BACI9J_60294 [Bacillus altitudinis]
MYSIWYFCVSKEYWNVSPFPSLELFALSLYLFTLFEYLLYTPIGLSNEFSLRTIVTKNNESFSQKVHQRYLLQHDKPSLSLFKALKFNYRQSNSQWKKDYIKNS